MSQPVTKLSVIGLLLLLTGCGATPSPLDAGIEVDAGPKDAGAVDAGAPDAGQDAGPPDAGLVDAGIPDAGSDAGSFVVAPHQAPPVLTKSAGPVLAAPKVVLATFDADPLATQLEAFAQAIGVTPYWSATTLEYGVAAVQFDRAVHLTGAPATISDTGIEAWLIGQLDGTHPEWGPVSSQTVYTVVYPASTSVTRGGHSVCSETPAYHGEIKVGALKVPYAVVVRCGPLFGLSGIDYLTAGLSHEWVETTTDPLYFSNGAFDGPASKYTAWTLLTGGELADMCTLTSTVYFKPAGLPFTVQRSWSNSSALADHDPCVPLAEAPYFNAAPRMPDLLSAKYYGVAFNLEGVKLPLGQSKTIQIDLFSDGPTGGEWSVVAVDVGPQTGGGAGGNLTFSWNKQKGQNGDTLELAVTRVKDSTNLTGAGVFSVISTLGAQQHVWVGAVGD